MRYVLLIFGLQWSTLRNSLRTASGVVETIARLLVGLSLLVADLGFGVVAAALVFFTYQSERFVMFATLALAVLSLLWQLIPFITGVFGGGLEIRRFRHYPISDSGVFALDLAIGALDLASLSVYPLLVGVLAGVALARPSAAPVAALGLLLFALFNVALARLVRGVTERLLARRRLREVVVVCFFLLAFVPQSLTLFTGRGRPGGAPGGPPDSATVERLEAAARYGAATPPGMAARALAGGDGALLALVGAAAFAAAMLALNFWRLRRELVGAQPLLGALFRRANPGTAVRVAPTAGATAGPGGGSRAAPHSAARLATAEPTARGGSWNAAAAVFSKEIRYFYRSPRALIVLLGSTLGPIVFMAFFRRFPSQAWLSRFALPLFCYYGLWQVASLFNNAFCFDGHGAKFYAVSPARGRDVLLGKNLTGAALAAVQTLAVSIAFNFLLVPLAVTTVLDTVLLVATALFLLVAIGNVVSAVVPFPVDPSKLSGAGQSGVSILVGIMVVGLVFGIVAVGPFVQWRTGSNAAFYAITGAELAAAAAIYAISLGSAGRLVESRIEQIVLRLTRPK